MTFPAAEILDAKDTDAKGMIRSNLMSNDAWLVRGLLAIYKNQTVDERNARCTKHYNNVGFNGADSRILSCYADQVLRHQRQVNPRYRDPLSPKQLNVARTRMAKYSGQLLKIARSKADV